MATEADKTDTGVIATAFAIGAAVMIGGSAAIVALARTEMDDVSRRNDVYADLQTVAALEAEQRQQLQTGEVPIDRAKKEVLTAIQRDALAASPASPATPAAAATGAAGEAAAAEAGATGGAGGAGATGTEREPTAGEAADQAGAATQRDKSAQERGAGDKPLESPAGEANTPNQAAPQGSAAADGKGQQR